MSAYGMLERGFPGLKQGVGYSKVTSKVAAVALPFGSPVCVPEGDENKAYKLPVSAVTGVAAIWEIELGGKATASGKAKITINGSQAIEVDVANSDTAAAVATALSAETAEGWIITTGGSGKVKFTAANTGSYANDAAFVVELADGLTLVGGNDEPTTDGVDAVGATKFLGVAMSTAKEGGMEYRIGETVNVLTRGNILVTASKAVQANTAAYIVNATGVWTDVSGSATAAGTFRTNAQEGELVEVELQ